MEFSKRSLATALLLYCSAALRRPHLEGIATKKEDSVLQKIERGLKDAEEGRVYSQEEVEKMMAKWIEK